MATLDGFVRSGKVRYIGCSNSSAVNWSRLSGPPTELGGTPLVSLQPQYSLIWRDIELDVLPTADPSRNGRHRLEPARRGNAHRKICRGGCTAG